MAGQDDSIIIVMRRDATGVQIEHLVDRLRDLGAEAHVSEGALRTVIGAAGDRSAIQQVPWEAFPGVERAVPILQSHRFVSRDFHPEDSIVEVGGVPVGGDRLVVVAGPCAVESRDQLFAAAAAVRAAGGAILRGDAFKPRTSPYAFQGLGEKGLQLLAEARDEFDMPFVAEVLDPREVELVSSYADMIRIGARNMANFTLLAEVGRQPKPVMLKRGMSATIDEWLYAAEYVYKEGNHGVVLCERGIRTFEQRTRNTLDLSSVPVVKGISHLPILVDPSHSAGRRELVPALARAAVAAGADGVMVDVHASPDTARVDGAQALLPEEFAAMMRAVQAIHAALADNG